MAKINQDVEVYQGEDVTVEVTITSTDITGWTLKAVFGGSVLKDNGGVGGISITDAANGVFEITLSDTDTDSLAPREYTWGVKRDDEGSEAVLSVGKFTVKQTPVND